MSEKCDPDLVKEKPTSPGDKSNSTEIPSSNVVSSADIFKLDVDCFEELFEFLSIAELRTIRQTCVRLKRVVDYFIRTNYPSIQIGNGKYTICIDKYKYNEFNKLDEISRKMIKQLTFWSNQLDTKDLKIIQPILPQLERFQIGSWDFKGDFYKAILEWCTNLKELSICNIQSDKIIGEGNEWMNRKYPQIEHIVFDDTDIGGPGNAWEIPELKQFFQINPNIRTFSTTFHLLWENRDCFLNSGIKFDQLNVKGDCFLENGMNRICGLLNKLHEQNVYKRVHMRATFIYVQNDMDEIMSVRGMEKLYLACVEIRTTIPPMPELREIGINYDGDFEDLDTIAKALINVERIHFNQIKSNSIIPFLRYAPKVKTIKIDHLHEGLHFKNGIINVVALNNIRKKLRSAANITIYIEEKHFLMTKWATPNVDLSLVTLKRNEAFS